jgi:hypothetical protein
MRVSNGCVVAVMFVICGMAAPVRAQTNVEQLRRGERRSIIGHAGVPHRRYSRRPLTSTRLIQKPAGPPPTPQHTGIKAMVGLVIDFGLTSFSREPHVGRDWRRVGAGRSSG